ncbi:hypothetical protein NHX12_020704 [Muraenolepis orangiensis]|uniref:C2 domain-containing protein n=1 Tax=Muraenolepis orangiensis TaxID=630683 RepID=A0A9Q0EU17_9TELE|nr:hypothetical protein NHX12_020704 [Muraenolepis orangiensis]
METRRDVQKVCLLESSLVLGGYSREEIDPIGRSFNCTSVSPAILRGIPGKKCGTVIVKESVMMQFCGNKLDKKDFFGKSDPFLVFYRSNEDGTFTICHKTEVVKNTLNPVWQAFKIPVRALCNGDYDRAIKIEVYDWDRDGG